MQPSAMTCSSCTRLIKMGKDSYVLFIDQDGTRFALHRGCFSKAFHAWSSFGEEIARAYMLVARK